MFKSVFILVLLTVGEFCSSIAAKAATSAPAVPPNPVVCRNEIRNKAKELAQFSTMGACTMTELRVSKAQPNANVLRGRVMGRCRLDVDYWMTINYGFAVDLQALARRGVCTGAVEVRDIPIAPF